MTTDKKRQRAGPDDSALALANEGKGKAPAAKAKGKDAAAVVGKRAAHAATADDDDNDASSSDVTSSSSSAYSSDTSGDDDDSDEDDDSSDEEDDEEEGGNGKKKKNKTGGKEIAVDFEFYDPKPIDFLGLKMLLGPWLDGLEFDSSGLCDALISQRTVGTVLKTEEAGDPIGVLSCLDARRSWRKKSGEEEGPEEGDEKEKGAKERGGQEEGRHVPALAQLERYLASCAPSPADAEKVRAAFAAGSERGKEKRHTGVVVSERLLNVPPAVAQPLHEALFDEIAWATEDEPTAELRDSFGFGQYLVVSRVYLDDDGSRGGEGEGEGEEEDESEDGKKKKNKKRARAAASAAPAPAPASTSSSPPASTPPVVVFARPEDQFFSEVAEWSFVFEPPALPEASDRHRQPQRRGELRRARLVALVDASRVPEMREKLREALGKAA